MIRSALLAAFGLALACSAALAGIRENDTGGIIPWSPQAQATARTIAQSNCAAYGKYAVIRSMRRAYGEYIVYECRFGGPLRRFGPG